MKILKGGSYMKNSKIVISSIILGVCTSAILVGCGMNAKSKEVEKIEHKVSNTQTITDEDSNSDVKTDIKDEKKDTVSKKNELENKKDDVGRNLKNNKPVSSSTQQINRIASMVSNYDSGSSGSSLKRFIVFENLVKNSDLLIKNEVVSKKIFKEAYRKSKLNIGDTVRTIKDTGLMYLNNYSQFKKLSGEAGVNIVESKISKAQLDKIFEIIGVSY